MIRIHASANFVRKFRQLDKEDRLQATEEVKLFRELPFYPSLNTHPLSKKFAGSYAFSVSGNLRIVFRFTKKDNSEVLFQSIGTHEIYK